MITGNLDVIPDSRVRYIISKGPLEFVILFLKVLNIDFPLKLISLIVVERSLLL